MSQLKFTIGFLITALSFSLSAQNSGTGIGAYLDERGRFIVWEDGTETTVEHQGVLEWQLSPEYVVYTDQAGEVHIFQDGRPQAMEIVRPAELVATNYFLKYRTRDQVSLVEKGRKHHFGFLQDTAVAFGDSIVGYTDYNGHLFVYFRGRAERLDPFGNYGIGAGDNVLAWIDQNARLRGFWNGRSGTLAEIPPKRSPSPADTLRISMAANTIAWENPFDHIQIFHKGRNYEPEGGYLPGWFKAGDDLVTWISQDREELYLFWDGKTRRILAETPQSVGAQDELVWFSDANRYFKVFYNGKIETLESYTPRRILARQNILLYTDLDGRIKSFYKGKAMQISENIAQEFGLNGDLVWWSERPFEYEFRIPELTD